MTKPYRSTLLCSNYRCSRPLFTKGINEIDKSEFKEETIMFLVSIDKGDFSFQTADDVLSFVQTAVQENSEIWIRGEQSNPYMAVCIIGEYAAIT